MSTNLATILVGLGYDLSALEKGAPEAFRLINAQTLGMSAEMKRASREGAESFRLIDEALGIRISRPLTRILTQEFPGFAKGLQSIIGVGIVGALGVAGVELFEKMARGIENAQKAQEEFAAASQKSGQVFSDAMQSYEKAGKLRSLSGLGLELFKIDSSSIEQARKYIDELGASFEDLSRKEEKANGFFTKMFAAIGDEAHVLYNTPTAQAAEQLGKQFGDFTQRFDELSKKDALHGTSESAKFITAQLTTANVLLGVMEQHRMTGVQTFLRNQLPTTQTGQFGFSDAEIEKQRQFVDFLQKTSQLQGAGANDQKGKDDEARRAAAIEASAKAIREFQEETKDWNEQANKSLFAWLKLNEQIEKTKAMGAFRESALPEGAALFAEFQKLNGAFQIGPPPGAPQRSDLAELAKVTSDQNAAWQKAGEILNQIETPAQKYSTQLGILKTLQQEGRITTEQFAQAQQVLSEELAKATDRMEKLMAKTGDASAGMQAFLLKLQTDAGRDGTFTFDILSKGLSGFEDETVKALTGAKTSWGSFFLSLDQMVMKFFLNKLVGQALGAIFPGFGGDGGGGSGGGNGADTPGMFASGTDFAPGGMAWVGEQGPELVNLPRGSSVTPNSALRGGGGNTVHVHIDARGGEIGVEEKIARAISDSAPQIIMRAVVEANEVRQRSLR